ncbi:MAG: Crp/Fnr family transcriptional regulator [Alkalispirochaetaceae bacterium]
MPDNPLFEKYGTTVRAGETIFTEGEPGDKMYIIQDGTVSITKMIDGKPHELAQLGKGDFFGEMAIVLQNTKRTATVKAVGAAQILAFDRQGFEGMIQKNAKIAMNVIDKLCRRLQNANTQIQQLFRSNERSLIALSLYNRINEQATGEGKLTFDRTVEEIALSMEAPPEFVSEVLYGFDSDGIIKVDGNVIVIKDKRRLVQVARQTGGS